MQASDSWDVEVGPEGAWVRIRGRFDEHADFTALAPEVARASRVTFDLSEVRAINSWGARQWILFLRGLPALDYVFVGVSVEFVKHCNMVADMLGSGAILTFTAPYACRKCHTSSEQVLEASAVARQLEQHQLPRFACAACGGEQELDDVPERFLAFLRLT